MWGWKGQGEWSVHQALWAGCSELIFYLPRVLGLAKAVRVLASLARPESTHLLFTNKCLATEITPSPNTYLQSVSTPIYNSHPNR